MGIAFLGPRGQLLVQSCPAVPQNFHQFRLDIHHWTSGDISRVYTVCLHVCIYECNWMHTYMYLYDCDEIQLYYTISIFVYIYIYTHMCVGVSVCTCAYVPWKNAGKSTMWSYQPILLCYFRTLHVEGRLTSKPVEHDILCVNMDNQERWRIFEEYSIFYAYAYMLLVWTLGIPESKAFSFFKKIKTNSDL